ncbi:MAG: GntR family transcriptional regulator [Actinomycetales bacterium]|nr:GntR family transcriptional regulator [Actinomycetales bacterium]
MATRPPASPAAPPPLGPAASQAREAVLELIESGVFPPGGKLPGERELAGQVSVSRAVLREALAALQHEGRLQSSPWRGWFVTSPHMAERVALQSFTQMARARNLIPGAHVVWRTTRPASLEESAALAIAPASPVHEVHRVRTLDGVPTCYDTSVLPTRRAPGIEDAELENASLYQTLESTAQVRIVRSDYTVRAEAATEQVAGHLDIEPGSPVLVGEEIASDMSGTPIVLGRVTYRHDAYEFQATLYRAYDAGATA